MEYKWIIREKADPKAVESLGKEINLNQTLANMLVNRGVDSFQKAKDFFRPDPDKLHDPYLMKDMDKAVERLALAIHKEEKILVYGDYDVDGTTSVAMFYGFLKQFYSHVSFYIPDRYKEGYGISEKGVRFAAENNFSLVVSLDCGIKAIEKVTLAKELGVEFINFDHPTPGDYFAPAVGHFVTNSSDCE